MKKKQIIKILKKHSNHQNVSESLPGYMLHGTYFETAAKEIKELSTSLTEQELQQIDEAIAMMQHAQTFITSRQKMHSTGVELFQKSIDELEEILSKNEPKATKKRK